MKNIYKSLLLLFSVHCSLFTVKAQEIEWQNTIGGSGHDELRSIQQTADGGYILGGLSTSNISGDKTENCIGTQGYHDYWIVKTDSIGNIQWQNTIGGSNMDYLNSIQQTNDRGYIFGGQSNSHASGDKTELSNGWWDQWIVKTDSLGNIQWQNTIGGYDAEELNSIKQTFDGGYILGGYSNSDISGDKTENCIGGAGNDDYWIIKTDATGNIQWQNTIGGNQNDRLFSVQQTADGGYILGGSSFSYISGDKTENIIGGRDYWIVKTDSAGNIQWQNTIGGNQGDYLYSTQQTSDGGYILGGYSGSAISGDKTENSNGQFDYWIVKTDSIGNIQWQNTIGGDNADILISLQQTIDNGYILGGWSGSGISGDKTENCIGIWDYWVVKTDSSGNIQWQNTIGGSNIDYLNSIQQTKDGGYILGGQSFSNISSDKTENCEGNSSDYWIVKLTDSFNTISGCCFVDLNSNNVIDSGEVCLVNKKITENNTRRFSFSEQNGRYSVSVLDSGSFFVSPQIINHYNVIPASHYVSFNGINQTDSLNDFAFQPSGVINDLRINITPLTAFRSGFNATYTMHYENVGTTTLNASVVFYLNDTNYNYVSSSVNPFLVTADSVVWNNISLAPFQSGDITVTVYVNLGLPIGKQLNALCLISPLAGDATQGDNWGSWKVFTTGAVDPNDILVDEDTLTTVQLAGQPYLEYIIRFQNTGNDTCFNAKILNPIDTTRLKIKTFELVASSHPVNLKWIPWERNMEFKFNKILLADSNTNEPLSHGYVRYRIKPKTYLHAGKKINNAAAIYFDYNNPVITNTASTIIVLPTTYATVSASACSSYLSPGGNYTWTTTGTYTDTLVNIYGGDSIVTVNLMINNTTSVINSSACYIYTSPSGNYLWTTSGIYHDTIPNTSGCDSIITINLSIENNTNSTINVNACDSYISPSGNYSWTTSGTYNDTLPNATGCDSIITINLSIINSSISVINANSCYSYTSPSGNYIWTASGTYNDTLPNATGCDSIITINLSINNSLSLINVNTCSSYTSPSGNYTWTATGLYLDTIPNTSGCDSVIVINLTINNSSSTINVNSCTGSYTSPSGNFVWTNSGVYYDTIPNAAGCDSMMMILLSVIAVDTTVTNNAPLLIANAAGAVYQWIYCDSIELPGATNQNFTATANGAYAVIVTQNGCTDTSSCYIIINVGLAEQIFSSAIFVSPNPFNSELTIFSNQLKDKAELKIYDVFGRIVFTMPITTLHTKLETQNFSSGVYFVEVKTDKGSVMQKIIKQ